MVCCKFLLTALLVFTFCLAPLTSRGDERLSWPDRSGPTYDGHVAPEDAVGLPVKWDEARGENIAWKIPLAGQGNSTPVIGAGKIWLTYATEDGRQQFLLCVDEKSGEVLFDKQLFENAEPEPLGNKVNTYASPSCALEQDAVYVHFGSYGTARIDPQTCGIVWQRRDIECRHFRGPGSTPVIFQNLLILTFDGIDQQFLMALDKQTGETVWRTDRSTNWDDLDENGKPRGNGDYRKAFSTPALTQVGGETQLISVGSRAAFGYDPLTGKEIWTITHGDYNASCRALFYRGRAIINTGSTQANLVCMELNETTRGDVTGSHVVWDRDKGNSELSSPILVGDRIFMIAANGVTSCLDPQTGENIWKARIGGTYVASPITANGLIYFSNEEGVTTVIKAADKKEEVSSNQLAEGMRASPAVAHGAIFLRTFSHLYKIQSP